MTRNMRLIRATTEVLGVVVEFDWARGVGKTRGVVEGEAKQRDGGSSKLLVGADPGGRFSHCAAL